ncbi:hypothetical protein BTM_5195 [Burkholderia thailandensis 34]|nr:hypothetical protein BTM_5195 [Burkholderia thailandensis 34]
MRGQHFCKLGSVTVIVEADAREDERIRAIEIRHQLRRAQDTFCQRPCQRSGRGEALQRMSYVHERLAKRGERLSIESDRDFVIAVNDPIPEHFIDAAYAYDTGHLHSA